MIKAVLFDLDGTLFDSSSGIFHTANFTMRALGFEECHDEKQLRKFVGPPLRECFRITYNTAEEYLDRCVEVYREEYRKYSLEESIKLYAITFSFYAGHRRCADSAICQGSQMYAG